MYSIEMLKSIAMSSEVNNKHAAGLLYNKNIVYYGINKYIKKNEYYKTIHAEVNLLKSIPFIKLNGRDIIVIRVNKNGRLRNSRPCNDCIDILKKLGIRRVHYSDSDGNILVEQVEYMNKIHVSSWNKRVMF
jgi:deoxycytidylate deaminase